MHTILLVLLGWMIVLVVGLLLWSAVVCVVPALQIWPWGRNPHWHRHQWRITRVTVPMFDASAKGILYYCTVDGCGKVHAK